MKLKTQAVIGAVILGLSFFLDKPVQAFFQSIHNPALDWVMSWFSNEMTVVVVLFIIATLFLYQEKKLDSVWVLLVSFISAFLVSKILKFGFMRLRPEGITYEAIGLGSHTITYPDYSMPSSHSATSFSVLPVIDQEFARIRGFWIFFAVMVAISRIYLNQHYLSDVIAGALLGYALGLAITWFESKYGLVKRFFQKV